MVMMPNPGALNDWPEHWDMGIHYVRPRNWGAELVLVIVFAIAVHILQKQTKTAKQYYFTNFSFTTFPISFRGSTKYWSCLQPVTPDHMMP